MSDDHGGRRTIHNFEDLWSLSDEEIAEIAYFSNQPTAILNIIDVRTQRAQQALIADQVKYGKLLFWSTMALVAATTLLAALSWIAFYRAAPAG